MSNLSQFAAGGDPQYWASGTTYALGKTVRSPTDHQRYVRVVAGAGATDPANDATNWRPDGGRAIKSVQRGVITIPGNVIGSVSATVSAVNPAKAELRWLGGFSKNQSGTYSLGTRVMLTSGTAVTAWVGEYSSSQTDVSWELTEYY